MRNAKGQFLKGHHWRQPQVFRQKQWLQKHYIQMQMSTGEIAAMFGVTDAAILFWMRKHSIPRRNISESRDIKHWGAVGSDNPMWNKKGELNPNWKGGITPERQAFYISQEWKRACSFVWKRDGATCRRCGLKHSDRSDMPFHIHHVIPFSNINMRSRPEALVLLCEACHHFVHSRRNVDCEYLPKD